MTLRGIGPLTLSVSPNKLGASQSGTATFTLECAAAPGNVVVAVTSSNPSVLTVSASSVTVLQGTSSGTFTYTAASSVSGSNSVTLTVTAANVGRQNFVTVKAPTPDRVSFNPASPVGGEPSTGTVIVDVPAPTGGTVVTLSSANPSVASPNVASITVAAGQTQATFGVTTTAVLADTQVNFTATANGVSKVGPLNVRKNRIEKFSLSNGSVSTCRGSTATVELRVPAGPDGATVTLTNNAPALVTLGTAVLVFAAGEKVKTFTITANGAVAAATTAQVDASFTGTIKIRVLDVVRVSRAGCQ
jgi:hypothetical protein